MMQPLSRKRRTWYLLACFVIFIIMAPVIILYATGYRLGESFQITRTGGLYIASAYSGAQIYVDDIFIKETRLFQKNALIQNLKPGLYKVRVTKDGLYDWEKELRVFTETVTDAHSFMLPREITLIEITPTIQDEENASSSIKKVEKNPQYEIVLELFNPKNIASSTEPKILGKLSLENISGQIHAIWLGKEESRPTYFCLTEVCRDEVTLKTGGRVGSFDFFPGRDDLVVLALPSGIYVSEIDDRSKQNIQPIIEGSNLDFRIENNSIYIKDGKKYYQVSF